MKKRLNPRRKWNPKDPLALLGYYTSPVQKVVDRWRPHIDEKMFDESIESLMIACNYSVQYTEQTAKYFHHKRFALEIAFSIEKIRQKWRGMIDDKILGIMLEAYITPLLSSITELGPNLADVSQKHKIFILELLLAVDEVLHNKKRNEGGILQFAFSGDGSDYENGRPLLRPWPKVATMIAARNGVKKIEPNTIAQLAKRMRLTK
jgi:hypothetical protein